MSGEGDKDKSKGSGGEDQKGASDPVVYKLTKSVTFNNKEEGAKEGDQYMIQQNTGNEDGVETVEYNIELNRKSGGSFGSERLSGGFS